MEVKLGVTSQVSFHMKTIVIDVISSAPDVCSSSQSYS